MDVPFRIEYENTKEDYLKGNRLHTKVSPINKRMGRIILLLLFLGVTLRFVFDLNDHPERGIVYHVTFAIISFFVLWGVVILGIKLLNEIGYRWVLPKGENNGVLGKHELIFERDYVIEKTNVNEAKFAWSSVPRIENGKDYILLFQTETSAHVIPKRIFSSEEEATQFVRTLEALRERARQGGLDQSF